MKDGVIVDTREKKPWTFKRFGLVTRRATLKSGDYSFDGFQTNGIAIERKSFNDLYGSMTAGRIRFYNELRRLGEFGMAALIVEADREMILGGSMRTCVNPGRMVQTLYAWCAAFKIQLHFANSAYDAETQAFMLMRGWADARTLRNV